MVQYIEKKFLPLKLKNRENQRGNEVRKPKIPLYPILTPYGDRFIPRRSALVHNAKNQKTNTCTPVPYDVFKERPTNYWRQYQMQKVFHCVLGLHNSRLLQLSDGIFSDRDTFVDNCDWPCKPRSKPYAFPVSSHDLPGLELDFDNNLVDWSVNEHIAASIENEVMVWERKRDTTVSYEVESPQSLAYSANGLFLAIGCSVQGFPALILWEVNVNGMLYSLGKKSFNKSHSMIRCIEWSKYEDELVCGTQSGHLMVLSVPWLHVLLEISVHNVPITMIKFSPTMRYLACADVKGTIIIYNWLTFEEHLIVNSKSKLNVSFDWHPWNGVDLVISEEVPASIVVINVPSQKFVAFFQRDDHEIKFLCVTFSKLTAELLVSISERIDGQEHFRIVVLSSLVQVVDILELPDGGVRFMKWSPDGTKLTAAGIDETLTIWNFYPSGKQFNATKTKLALFHSHHPVAPGQHHARSQFNHWSCIR